MKITFLKLTENDKNKLKKLATAKHLSLSTTANIITKHLFWFTDDNKYLKQGNTQTTIKVKNECNFELNVCRISNCIVLYFEHEHLNAEKYKITDLNSFWKHQTKEIQKELDKTKDINWNLNEEIRAYYRAKNHLERQRA